MLRRLLSFLGLTPSLPAMPAFSGTGTAAPETDGQTAVSFSPGKKAAPSAAEAEETHDERRKRITDSDLVWPGKTETIGFRNEEAVVYRFELTVTDLDPSYYVRRPPTGGLWQPEGGVLLQPGEETVFEVVFAPPPPGDKPRPRTFSFVITGFDPRRANDPGEVFAELPSRWVNLPTNADLRIAARPAEVIIRPWRRSALFQVEFQNLSYLPPSVQMAIQRAPTKETLKDPEQVGTLGQSLESRTGGIWHVLIPSKLRNSYFATVTGSARVADNMEFPLILPQPVYVRYIPWLRVGKDWVFLGCGLLFLLWLVWGIPIHKSPVAHFTLNFQLPPGGSWDDLQVTVPYVDGPLSKPILASKEGNTGSSATYKIVLPGRWCGYRWPFGWNGASQEPEVFRLSAGVAAQNKSGLYSRYDLNALKTEQGRDSFETQLKSQPMLGDWVVTCSSTVQLGPNTEHNVENVVPGTAKHGENLTITGQNFGQDAGKVLFNGKPAIAPQWTDTKIVIAVPDWADSGAVSVNIQLSNGDVVPGQTITVPSPTAPPPVVVNPPGGKGGPAPLGGGKQANAAPGGGKGGKAGGVGAPPGGGQQGVAGHPPGGSGKAHPPAGGGSSANNSPLSGVLAPFRNFVYAQNSQPDADLPTLGNAVVMAVAKDPNDPTAQAIQGYVHLINQDPAAANEIAKAAAANPNDPMVLIGMGYQQYQQALKTTRDYSQARGLFARVTDPGFQADPLFKALAAWNLYQIDQTLNSASAMNMDKQLINQSDPKLMPTD